ncbi:hypothetical protein Z969_10435 [Clostridium novyi A str. 4570]|uniref:Uncharacterized protein n=1 Tax=Clostridium novyi A str. 4570 TaxID=1444290 RepID=A0AA88ZJS0_CLONO|nr:hypothetical protein [Clostridium novyi]KGM99783.1 hypothetical protein Z969_10435 [Clostridium novyi A str. 4570]
MENYEVMQQELKNIFDASDVITAYENYQNKVEQLEIDIARERGKNQALEIEFNEAVKNEFLTGSKEAEKIKIKLTNSEALLKQKVSSLEKNKVIALQGLKEMLDNKAVEYIEKYEVFYDKFVVPAEEKVIKIKEEYLKAVEEWEEYKSLYISTATPIHAICSELGYRTKNNIDFVGSCGLPEQAKINQQYAVQMKRVY